MHTDAAVRAGFITEIRRWWNVLSTLGPDFGYFPNDRKCWIIAKPAKEESVREVEIEAVLQDSSGEHLNTGSNKAQDVRVDIHARDF